MTKRNANEDGTQMEQAVGAESISVPEPTLSPKKADHLAPAPDESGTDGNPADAENTSTPQPSVPEPEQPAAPTPEPVEVPADLIAQIEEAAAPVSRDQRRDGTAPNPAWSVEDYLPGGNDSASAAKLADSAVAPLVVAARGYETVHEDGLPDATKRFGLPRKTTSQGKRIAESITRGDLLIMPWFTPDDVHLAARSLREPRPSCIQFRPAKPEKDEDGRERKYEFVTGHHTPLGLHPGIPVDWIDSTSKVLIAEGLLKGDSALTAFLLAHGATEEDLAWDGTGDVSDARARLRALLDAVPEDDRVLILAIAGVDNWRKNPEWRSMRLAARDTWLGVDGDVASNANVHRAMGDAWSYLKDNHRARPFLLAPVVTLPDGVKKVGIDDYCAKYGGWNSLLDMLADTLPPKPPSNDAENAGKFRISADGTLLEECEPVKDDPFNPEIVTRGRWVTRAEIGGRILSIVASRIPTEEEIRTGLLGGTALNDAADSECEVEISWVDPIDASTIHRKKVTGPDSILTTMPDRWDSIKGIHIPAAVRACEYWPPPRKFQEEWLRAIKAHRREEKSERIQWDCMGWVPVVGSVPAFIVGDQIIGQDDHADVDILAGVGDRELAGATKFGVGELDPRRLDDEDYANEVRANIEKVIDALVLAQPFTDRRVASTVLAAGLRPVVPLRSNACVFCLGAKRKGKSLTASVMLSFLSRQPGDFRKDSLPGSAKDTATAIELALARSISWVIDDLAPSTSRMESEREQAKIADVVRNKFNGSGKRRSNVDLGARKQYVPRGFLIITAENELTVPSARDRCVTLNIGYGALNSSTAPTDALEHLCFSEGSTAKVTQALIKYIRGEADSPQGWATLYQRIESTRVSLRQHAAKNMKFWGAKPGDLTRHADIAGDLAVPLVLLRELAQKVGVRKEILDLLSVREMVTDIFSLVADGHATNNESTPGKSLIEGIAGILLRNKAHIASLASPGSAPTDDQAIATRLGWEFASDGTARPKGDLIGFYVVNSAGERIIYLDQQAAFSVASREYPNLIPPGQGFRESWKSVIGEGLAVESLLRFKNGQRLSTGRVKTSEGKEVDHTFSGTPITLDLLLAGGNLEAKGQAA